MSNDRAQPPPLPTSTHHPGATSRRKFLLQCSAVAAVAAVPASAGLGSSLRWRQVSLDRIGFSTFSRLVGTHFGVDAGVARIQLELIEVSAGRAPATLGSLQRIEPDEFSLIFAGPKNPPLEQNSYAFVHEQIGGFVMFIVPIWDLVALTGVRYYEAAFNRPKALAT